MSDDGEDASVDAPEAEKPVVQAPEPPKPVSAIERYASHAPRFFELFDFSRVPRSKVGWVVRVAAVIILTAILWRRVVVATHPLVAAAEPSPIPTQEIDDYKFKLPERTRREIFADLAAAELSERARAIAANSWNGHLWSREDDRGHYERVACRAAAAKYRTSLTQVYLVLDEGIREHWEGPDGKPLSPHTPALSLRSTW